MSDQSALEAALAWLNRADRSEFELRRHLAQLGFPDSEIDHAVATCGRYGYLDDDSLAGRVRSSMARKLAGDLKIEDRLERRGMNQEVVSEDGVERAMDLLKRRFRSVAGSNEPKTWAKAARHLASQGYREEEIRSALESFFPGVEF